MYQALYRKWRPQTFSDVVGQNAVTSALSNQILTNRVGHAYLMTGTRGTGKTTCAKIFAKAVNCEKRQGAEPCGECVPCKGLEDGSLLDVIEIDAASNNSVDDIRDLRDETVYRPSRCQYKVYIIDEVHMLSASAFNALLKIMEEPPSHVIFILATTELHKVPATILSRCQRFDFTRIPAEAISERLLYIANQENIKLDKEAALLIARLADGALRDALSLLDTCAGLGDAVDEHLVRRMAGISDKGYLFQLSDAISSGSVEELLVMTESLRQQSTDVRRLTEELISHYRGIMLAKVKPDGSLLSQVSEQERAKLLQTAPSIDTGFAINAMRRLASALDQMGRSPDPRIELEIALIDLTCPKETVSSISVNSKVERPATQRHKAPAVSQKAETYENSPPWKTEVLPEKPVQETSEVIKNHTEQTSGQEPISQQPQPQDVPAPVIPKPVEPPPDGAIVVFEPWPDVVSRMSGINTMLYSYMKNATAYTDGKRVLIDGGDMFLSFMRTDEKAGEQIKSVIQDITGTRYGIGPYTKEDAAQTSSHTGAQSKQVTARDTLEQWEQQGVKVEYE